MPVIYPKAIRRKFQSLNLELIKESLAEEGYDFIRDGGFTKNDKPFKFCNYLFYKHPKSKTRIRVGYDYPSILNNKNRVFEICYAKQGDEWWTDIVPDFREKKWRKISEWYSEPKSIKKCTKN